MSMIYHLEIEAKFCKVKGLINKFPIYELDGTNPAIFSKPINSVLIEKNNDVTLVIIPTDLFHPEKKKYIVRGSVKKYLKDEFTGPDQGEIIHSFEYVEMPAANFQFDNEKFDFSKLLKKGDQFENKELLVGYAEKLLKLIEGRKSNELLNEFRYKLIDYAICYDIPHESMFDQFIGYLENKIYANEPITDISINTINLNSWCDNRIWEIGVGIEMDALLKSKPNSEGNEYVTKIFVGKVNGELKVVR